MMFVSVVVAFAMSELLMGWGRLIRARERVRHPFLLAGWSLWLLMIMTYHYLGFWEYQVYDFTRVGPMLLFMAAPIMMVLLTFVVTPDLRHFQEIDLEEHFFSAKNWFFAMVFIFLALARASDPLLPNYDETWVARLWGSFIISASIVVLLFTDNRRIHYGFMIGNLIFLGYISFTLPVRGLTGF